MRLDRFITLNLIRPFRRSHLRMGQGDAGRIPEETPGTNYNLQFTHLPVLMYHSVADDPEQGVHPYYRVCVSPARFREQMQWLKENGWQGVALSTGLAWLDSKAKMEDGRWRMEVPGRDKESSSLNSGLRTPDPELRPVAITFDDGFRDFYTTAWLILQEAGFAATMYLPAAFIQDDGPRTTDYRLPPPPRSGRGQGEVSRPDPFKDKEFLTWDQVRELRSAGVEFGSHTMNHPKLVELPWTGVELEIQKSKSEIEDRLGGPCTAFAYPYAFPQADGNFVDRFKHLLQAGGYTTCVTTQLGRHRSGEDVLQIKRLPINQEDDLPLFAAKLDGAYDWLGRVQSLSKTLRRGRKAPAQVSRTGVPGVVGAFSAQPKTKNV